MKKYALVVEVPAIDEDENAYDPGRPISGLLMHQLRVLHIAEQHLPEKSRTRVNISRLHTELDASEYIQKVMKKLHPPATKKASKIVKRGSVVGTKKGKTAKNKKRK